MPQITSASQLNPDEQAIAYTALQKPTPGSTLLASARRITSRTLKRPGFNGKHEAWMEDAWDMYDLVGEQRFLATTLANRSSQARFFVGKLPDDDTEEPMVLTWDDETLTPADKTALEAWDAFVGKGQHFSQITARGTLNLFITGDCWLIGIPKEIIRQAEEDDTPMPVVTAIGVNGIEQGDPDADPIAGIDITDLDWRLYSITEVQVEPGSGTFTIHHDTDTPIKVQADQVIAIRIWRPHPRRWTHSDSPTRSSLPVLRELVGLTMHISAQVDSRLAGAGLLLIPQTASQYIKAASGANADDDTDPFMESLMEAMITPVTDRSSAAALVPLGVVVPDDSVANFKLISFSSPLDGTAQSLRDEAIRRLALGQDCPPELLLGQAGMNHWGAWLVREDVVTTHIEPGLALQSDAYTSQYLWPVLEAKGIPADQAREYVIWYDVSHLVMRPNRTADAITLHGAGALSDTALRDAAGFDDADAPEVIHIEGDDDPIVAYALQMVAKTPSLAATPGLPNLADQLRVLFGLEPKAPLDAPDTAPKEVATSKPAPVPAAPNAKPEDDGGVPATQDAPAEEPAVEPPAEQPPAMAAVEQAYGVKVLDRDYSAATAQQDGAAEVQRVTTHIVEQVATGEYGEIPDGPPRYLHVTHGGA
jgi:hypothetical protein